jgi:hypothetical protein
MAMTMSKTVPAFQGQQALSKAEFVIVTTDSSTGWTTGFRASWDIRQSSYRLTTSDLHTNH